MRLPETADEDGDPCECIHSLRDFVHSSLEEALALPGVDVRAVNVSAYGASLVYIDPEGRPLTPLYNYLKSYPAHLRDGLHGQYGGKAGFSRQTASPRSTASIPAAVIPSENGAPRTVCPCASRAAPAAVCEFPVDGTPCADITSIGCHTAMWDFERNDYHSWIQNEQLAHVMAPLRDAGDVVNGVVGEGDSYRPGAS